jgi:hypothetical protein
MFLGRTRPLLLLVLVHPEVHDAADGRHRGGGDLDEIQSLGARERHGLRRRHDAQLLARVVDDADFPYSDAFVDADAIVTPWAAIECDMNPLG